MNLKRLLVVGPVFLTLGLAASANAAPIVYTAVLAGSNEVPPVSSEGTGTATYTLDGTMLKIDLTFADLSGAPIAGHIHCCAPLGTNAAVAVPFVGLPASPTGIFSTTLDLNLLSTYNPAFVTAYGGTLASAESAFLVGLGSGQTYTNLHTALHPSGEIRGQIGLAPVPEPSSLLLLGTGVVGIVQAVRRRTSLTRLS